MDPRDATGGRGRDGAVDLVRAVALIRVVTYHAVGLPYVLTWISSMPVMFFIAGYFVEASLAREAALRCVTRRIRRVLVPLFPYAVLVMAVYVVTGHGRELGIAQVAGFFVPLLSFPGPSGPIAATSSLGWTFIGLWYLQNYMLFLVVSPLLRRVLARRPWAVAVLMGSAWVVALVVGEGGRLTTFLLAWTLGMAVRQNPMIATRAQWKRLFVAGLAVGSLAFFTLAAPVGSVAGRRWYLVSLVALGAGWIGGLQAFRSPLGRLAARRRIYPLVGWINGHAVSIYLWHFPAFGAGMAVAHLVLGPGWGPIHGLVSLVMTFTLTAALAATMAGFERLGNPSRTPVRLALAPAVSR